jgi:hypothetical protein
MYSPLVCSVTSSTGASTGVSAPGAAIFQDAAYPAKYDSHGPRIIGTVVGPDAHRVTVRLVPEEGNP